jgi:hypothetical protein
MRRKEHGMSDLAKARARMIARVTTQLPPGTAAEQIAELIERPDTEAAVQALEPDVLFRLIKTAGWDQGSDLVALASPSQFQSFCDLDVWRRDRFIGPRLDPWLGEIVDSATDERFKRVCRELDAEVLALYVQEGLEVYDVEEGMIPDEAPDRAEKSPDGMYALVYPEDEDRAALMRRMIARLYELDRVLAWTLIEAVRYELRSEMEEYAYRWRTSRLEEFGFVARDEALAIYRPIDAERLRGALEEGSALEPRQEEGLTRFPSPPTLDLPRVLRSSLDEDFLVLSLIAQIQDDALLQARLYELSSLTNKAMIADGIEPGEIESGRQVLRRTLGYLSLGLDYLSGEDEERAAELLAQRSLRELFRAGYSLVAGLGRQARRLLKRPTLTLVDGLRFSLLREEDAALLDALLRTRPTYAADSAHHAEFSRQRQVDDAALRLGVIGFKQLWVFGVARVGLDELAREIYSERTLNTPLDATFDAIFATAVARELIGQDPHPLPLGRAELGALLGALAGLERGERAERAGALVPRLTAAVAPFMPGASSRLFTDWLEDTLDRLVEELGAVREVEDAQIVTQLVLLASE